MNKSGAYNQRLFSYGTLQLESMQLEVFGRLLNGKRDILFGYTFGSMVVSDEEVIRSSGTDRHPIFLVHAGLPAWRLILWWVRFTMSVILNYCSLIIARLVNTNGYWLILNRVNRHGCMSPLFKG